MDTVRPSTTGRLVLAGLVAVLCFVLALPAGAIQRWQKARTGTQTVAAKGGADVTISGWATFSGQHMVEKEDDPKDSTGVDDPTATGAIGDGSEILGSDFIYRPENEDFFWRLELKKIPVIAGGIAGVSLVGSPTTLYGLKFTIKNDSYQIRAARVGSLPDVPPDPDNPPDPNDSVGHSFGLFTCTETTCEQVAQLRGGYGTTGERIVVALPLKVLRDQGTDVQEDDIASDFIAFSALAPFQGVVTDAQFFDDVRLEPANTPVPKKSITVTVGKKSVKLTDGNGLKDGYFDAKFPASLFKKSTTVVKTRTCLGNDCVNQSFKVTK